MPSGSGYSRPANIRNLIKRNLAEIEGFGPLLRREAMVGIGSGAERETEEFWLTEEQALLVATLSKTENVEIHDRNENLNLTDMWRAMGAPSGRGPGDWLDLASAKEFVACIDASYNAGKSGIMTKRGKGGGTYAHWQIGLAYAKYLSPEFHKG